MQRLLTLLIGIVAATGAEAGSLHFLGLADTAADRVEIRLDAPARPIDVGGDFTIEFFLRAEVGSNPVSANCDASNDRWIVGNIVLDRDVFGPGDFGDYGVALMAGRIAFGVSVGSNGATACGSRDLRDGLWHHIALTRAQVSGDMRVYVDGSLDAQVTGAAGDIAYRDGRNTAWPNSDPFLVLGSEKHFGPEAFAGWLDELRISRVVRYNQNFTPPVSAWLTDADTVGLYSFDEGAGTQLGDRSGAAGGPSPGLVRFGGNPSGPVWSALSPFASPPLFADGFE